MSDSSFENQLIDMLADDFLERYRAGERPPLSEYKERYPHLAEEIDDLFPALVLLEKAGSGGSESVGGVKKHLARDTPKIQQLGDYEILRVIGSGGMGVVYEAVQKSLGRHVALKVLPSHATNQELYLQRFYREAKSAARLHHSHIVPVYDVGEDDGTHFYAMQYIQGHGLDQVLVQLQKFRTSTVLGEEADSSNQKDISLILTHGLLHGDFAGRGSTDVADFDIDEPADNEKTSASDTLPTMIGSGSSDFREASDQQFFHGVARIGVQIADALHYAHEQGILHRDVKPSNLLLDTTGHIWITDFGLAKATDEDDLTKTGDVVGTMRYLAPERFRGQAGPGSDIYSLGLTLYEMLVGQPAFAQEDRLRLIDCIKNQTPAPPRQLDRRIPRDLETILLKSIEKEPAQRYASAQAMAEDLQRYLEDQPIRARPITFFQRFLKWVRRHPLIFTLLLFVFLSTATGATISTMQWRRAEQALQTANQALADKDRAFRAKERQQKQTAAALRKARQTSYYLRIALADREWWANHANRTRQLLAECPEDLREWEWHYLNHLSHKDRKSILIPEDFYHSQLNPVDTLARGSNGKYFAVCNRNGEVRVCKMSGEAVATFQGGRRGTGFSPMIHFHPQLPHLAYIGTGGVVRVWDVERKQTIANWHLRQDRVFGMAIEHHHNWLALGLSRSTVLYDVVSGREIRKLAGNKTIGALAVRPDGKQLAGVEYMLTSSGIRNRDVVLWDTETGKVVQRINAPPWRIYCLAYSPDGSCLAAGCEDNSVRLWNPTTGKASAVLWGHDDFVYSIHFHPHKAHLVSAGKDQTVRLWDWKTGKNLMTIRGHGELLQEVRFSANGDRLITLGNRTVKVWNADPYQDHIVLPKKTGAPAIQQGTVSVPGKRTATLSFRNGLQELQFQESATGKIIGNPHRLDSKPSSKQSARIRIMKFSPDGQYLATAHYDNSVMLWHARTGKDYRQLPSLQTSRPAFLFSPNSTLLAIRDKDFISLWDVSTGKKLQTLSTKDLTYPVLAFRNDGKRLAAVSLTGKIRCWDLASGQQLHEWQSSVARVACATYDDTGRRLAIGGGNRIISVMNMQTGEEIHKLVGHSREIRSVCFTPNGNRLLSTSLDQALRVWDTATGMEVLAVPDLDGYVYDLQLLADSRFAVGNRKGSVRLFSVR